MNLKKTLIISAAAVGAAFFLYGCGGNDAASSASSESDTISVGTTAGYSEDVVEFVAKRCIQSKEWHRPGIHRQHLPGSTPRIFQEAQVSR